MKDVSARKFSNISALAKVLGADRANINESVSFYHAVHGCSNAYQACIANFLARSSGVGPGISDGDTVTDFLCIPNSLQPRPLNRTTGHSSRLKEAMTFCNSCFLVRARPSVVNLSAPSDPPPSGSLLNNFSSYLTTGND